MIGIRVFAGGALVDQEPSPHTYKTKFFTLDLFRRDRQRAENLSKLLPTGLSSAAASLRYVTGTLNATTALVGFATPEQVESAVAFCEEGPLKASLVDQIARLARDSICGTDS